MTDQLPRLTEAELDQWDQDAAQTDALLFGGSLGERLSRQRRLIVEVRRLRALVKRLAAYPHPDDDEGFCILCEAYLGHVPKPEPHLSDCPWPELEAEAERR